MDRNIEEIEEIIMNREKDDVMYINGDTAIWMPMGWASRLIRKSILDPSSVVSYTNDGNPYVHIKCSDGKIVLIE